MTGSTPYVTNGVLVCSDGTRQTLKRWGNPVVALRLLIMLQNEALAR